MTVTINTKKLILMIGIPLVLLLIYIGAGPYITISSIKSGVLEKDQEKLSRNVDFPKLRQNLKEQLNALMVINAEKKMKGNPFASLATVFATKVIDGMVNSYITPSGLAAIMKGERPLEKSKKIREISSGRNKKLFENARMSYDSINRFSIWISHKNGKNSRFILERDGLSWKLVNIIIPV